MALLWIRSCRTGSLLRRRITLLPGFVWPRCGRRSITQPHHYTHMAPLDRAIVRYSFPFPVEASGAFQFHEAHFPSSATEPTKECPNIQLFGIEVQWYDQCTALLAAFRNLHDRFPVWSQLSP